jgi:hypothetical protein
VLPDGLTVVNPDAIAMLKGAPHPELARAFIEFVLSEKGQRLWILRKGAEGGPSKFSLYRMSVIPGLAQQLGDDVVARTDPFAFKTGFTFDIDKKNKRRRIMSDLFGACIVDTRKDLAKAWEALKGRPATDPLLMRLLAPPASEAELVAMATRWDDARFRNDTTVRWASEARDRYRRLAEEAR